MSEKVSLKTEFDELLAGFKRKIFTILGVALGLALLVEFVLIFFVMSDTNVLRMQSFNGALVMAGGLTVVAVTSLLLILPTKLIAYESLKLVRQSTDAMNKFVEKADRVMDRADGFMNDLDSRSSQAVLDLKTEGRKIREELEGVRRAFTDPVKTPMSGRPIRKVDPKEFASAIETGAKASGDNGTQAG